MRGCEIGGKWHHDLGDDGCDANEETDNFEDDDVGCDREANGQCRG